MNKLLHVLGALALVLGVWATSAQAGDYGNRKGSIQVGGGIGFDLSPTGFALGMEGEYFVTQSFSIVPKFTIALPSNSEVFTLTGDMRYTHDFSSADLRPLKPFINAGAGIAIGSFGFGPFNNDDVAFMVEFGGGANYYVTKEFAIGTEMTFMIPIELFNDNFIYQWQVAKARYLFD